SSLHGVVAGAKERDAVRKRMGRRRCAALGLPPLRRAVVGLGAVAMAGACIPCVATAAGSPAPFGGASPLVVNRLHIDLRAVPAAPAGVRGGHIGPLTPRQPAVALAKANPAGPPAGSASGRGPLTATPTPTEAQLTSFTGLSASGDVALH